MTQNLLKTTIFISRQLSSTPGGEHLLCKTVFIWTRCATRSSLGNFLVVLLFYVLRDNDNNSGVCRRKHKAL